MPSMRSRRAISATSPSIRLIAALATVFIAASGVGTSLYPHSAAARDCCKKRCDHGAPSGMRACCCDGAPASPVASSKVPATTPVLVATLPVRVATVALLADGLHPLRVDAPPGTPGFLERCTLLL